MNTTLTNVEETTAMNVEKFGSVENWLASIAPSLGSQMWSIIDANAFTINRDESEDYGFEIITHKPATAEGVTVTAACGLVAYSDYFNTYPENFTGNDVESHRAEWAGGYDGQVQCSVCKAEYPNW